MKRGMILFLLGVLLLIEFTSAACSPRKFDWGSATAVENTDVTISFMVEGDTCQGKIVSFSVKEYDHGFADDAVSVQPASITITSNSPNPGTWVYAGGTWRTQYMEDTDHPGETNPPEYYLTAVLDGQTYTTREDSTYVFSNQYMSVTKYVAPIPQCTNNTWCQSNYGVNYICSIGNCVLNSSVPPSDNSTAYIPKNCSDSEIKKTWDSVFQESSSGAKIITSNVSLSPDNSSCPYYFASKVNGNEVSYIFGSHIWFIFDMTVLNAMKIKANSEFLGYINNYNNVSDTFNSEKIMDLEKILANYTLMRSVPLTFSSANQTFLSTFKITQKVWEEENFTDISPNDFVYSFNDTQNTSTSIKASVGIITKNREYASYTFLDISFMDINDSGGNLTLKQQAAFSINQSQKKLQAFENKTLSYPIFYRESIENAVDVAGLQQQINNIRNSYNLSNSSAEYQRVINLSASLNIPTSISTTETANAISFFPQRGDVAPNIIADITGEAYDSNRVEDYKDAILTWYQKNIDSFIDFEEISVADNYGTNPLIKVFRVNIDEKTDTGKNIHFIIRKLENLKFERNYGETEQGDYVHINAVPGTIITFSTTEDINFVDLPLFVSPDLTALSLASPPSPQEKDSRWWLFLIIILVILVIGATGYIFINKWYKNKYEIHLFKTKNNLFNILSYINNSKKNGMPDLEVKNRLKKSGWTGEQMDYAMRKYYGKKIFMTSSYGQKINKNSKFVPRR